MDNKNLDKQWFQSFIKQISTNYNIPLNELKDYYKKSLCCFNQNNMVAHCKAIKQDGLQCTRKCKFNNMFCGKHLVNRKYGCVSNSSIELNTIKYNKSTYYIDDHNIVYMNYNINKYKIVGKMYPETRYIKFI